MVGWGLECVGYWLIVRSLVGAEATGVSQPAALGTTLLIRACTLWYGELVGGIALAAVVRRAPVPTSSPGPHSSAS